MKKYIIFIFLVISFITLYYCYRYNTIIEKFSVKDFDDVLDYKCFKYNPMKPDYSFRSSKCESVNCPMETCSHLIISDGTNAFQSINSEQTKSNVDDDTFICSSKHNGSNVRCGDYSDMLTCPNLGVTTTCYEYDGGTYDGGKWNRKTYNKEWTLNGECTWFDVNERGKFATSKTDDDIEKCESEPYDCSQFNYPCSARASEGSDPVAQFITDSSDVTGKTCIQYNACGDICTLSTEYLYKLINKDDIRQFVPIPYTNVVHSLTGVCGKYDVSGNHMPTKETPYSYSYSNKIFTKIGLDPLFQEIPDGLENGCMDYPLRYCCNLDDQGMFVKYKYKPVLNSRGTQCEYVPFNTDDSLYIYDDLLDNTLTGFNCNSNLFRLCPKTEEYRDIQQQQCRPCNEGYHIKDNSAFTHNGDHGACRLNADCSGTDNIDKCWEATNDPSVYIFQDYQKLANKNVCEDNPEKPHIGHSDENKQFHCFSDIDDCGININISSPGSPGSKMTVINEDGNIIANYCIQCEPHQEFNSNSFRCEDTVECSSISTKCLNYDIDNILTYTNYNLTQDDIFSPCYYEEKEAIGINKNRIDVEDCLQDCPSPYIKSTDGLQCIIPICNVKTEHNFYPSVINSPAMDDTISKFNNIDDMWATCTGKNRSDCIIDSVNDKICKLTRYDYKKTYDVADDVEEAIVCIDNTDTYRNVGHIIEERSYTHNGLCPTDCELGSIKQHGKPCDKIGTPCTHDLKTPTTNTYKFRLPGETTTNSTNKRIEIITPSEGVGTSCIDTYYGIYPDVPSGSVNFLPDYINIEYECTATDLGGVSSLPGIIYDNELMCPQDCTFKTNLEVDEQTQLKNLQIELSNKCVSDPTDPNNCMSGTTIEFDAIVDSPIVGEGTCSPDDGKRYPSSDLLGYAASICNAAEKNISCPSCLETTVYRKKPSYTHNDKLQYQDMTLENYNIGTEIVTEDVTINAADTCYNTTRTNLINTEILKYIKYPREITYPCKTGEPGGVNIQSEVSSPASRDGHVYDEMLDKTYTRCCVETDYDFQCKTCEQTTVSNRTNNGVGSGCVDNGLESTLCTIPTSCTITLDDADTDTPSSLQGVQEGVPVTTMQELKNWVTDYTDGRLNYFCNVHDDLSSIVVNSKRKKDPIECVLNCDSDTNTVFTYDDPYDKWLYNEGKNVLYNESDICKK
jgi:hypothetical protein